MKNRVPIIFIISIMLFSLVFVGCGSDSEVVNESSKNELSMEISSSDEKDEPMKEEPINEVSKEKPLDQSDEQVEEEIEKAREEQPEEKPIEETNESSPAELEEKEEGIKEEKKEEESKKKKKYHADTTWGTNSIGPVTVEAPVSWLLSTDGLLFYSPKDKSGDTMGYYLSVGFNGYGNGNIDFFMDRDLKQYEDVTVDENLVINGHPAVCLQYDRLKDGKWVYNLVYYIQIFPKAGLATFSYSAPSDSPEDYEEEFFRMMDSYTVDESKNPNREYEQEFVINTSTGVFHEESCYKVKQIDNPKYVTSTASKLRSKGYSPCGICNPH